MTAQPSGIDAVRKSSEQLADLLQAQLREAPKGDWEARCTIIEQLTDAITLHMAEIIASEFNGEDFSGKERVVHDPEARKELVRRMNIIFRRWGLTVEPETPKAFGKQARSVLCCSGGHSHFGVRLFALGSSRQTTTKKSKTQPDGLHIPTFQFAARQISNSTNHPTPSVVLPTVAKQRAR